MAALEPGATSWSAILDTVRLGPADDATAVIAAQLRGVVERLNAAGQWHAGDPAIVIVSDAGYDVTRLAWVLRDLPVEMVGRVRSDRVMRLPKPQRMHGVNGRPLKHGPEFRCTKPDTWPEPAITTVTDTSNYGKAETQAWDRVHPRLTHHPLREGGESALERLLRPPPPLRGWDRGRRLLRCHASRVSRSRCSVESCFQVLGCFCRWSHQAGRGGSARRPQARGSRLGGSR